MEDLDIKLSLDKLYSSVNIAEEIDEQALEKIGQWVCEGYETDKRSRKTWEDNVENWLEQAMQLEEKKQFPWPDAANVKYPLITTAALQFSARSYAALIPGSNVVRGRVIGFDEDGTKTERAMRVGKHMSYQLLEEMQGWEEEMDRLLFALPIMGCMFKKTYFDSILQHNVSEIVYPKELVVNYWSKNLEESERITHVLRMTENDIFERKASGIYLDQELEKNASELKERVTDNVLGTDKPQEDETLPYLILEQHCYMDLDGDGYNEPYLVVADANSGKVLRIVARYGEESITYNSQAKLQSIKPDHYFTKFSFIPSPDGGFYDIGFGVLLGPINKTIDSLINMLLDSGTLSNMQAGFISRGIRIKGGNKNFKPGEWKQVNSAGEDLRKGLVPLPVREPSQVLFSLLGMMIESGEKLSSVTEVMTGEIPGQNTKATVAMAAIEQGMKVFSSIYKRIHRSLTREYRKLYKLNSIFLPKETYFTILDIGQEKASTIGQSDYTSEDVDVVPTSDPNVATEEQRLAKVQSLFEVLQMGTVNPQEVTKRFLEATEQPNVEALMQLPEQGPSPEELEMQFEQHKFEIESEQKWEELEIKRIAAEAISLKNIADAEAAEEGDQLAIYQQQQKLMQEDDHAAQKLRQAEESHQQKLRQQEQAAEMKRRQMAQGGNNGTGTDNSTGV